jgi:hypothetical protein
LLCVVQRADKLAALDRRESDLKAQQHSLANDAQAFKDKEGKSQQPLQCILQCIFTCGVDHPASYDQNNEAACHACFCAYQEMTHMTAACKLCAMRPVAQNYMQLTSS